MKNVRQHIILVSIDTLRADCIQASPRANAFRNKYNIHISLKTDPLDKVVKAGTYYNNCFSAAPYTSASHAAYFTGLWPRHNGIYEFFNRKLIAPTIFEHAKKQGYITIFQTDFPVILGKYLGFTTGIDHYFIEDEKRAYQTLFKNRQNKTISFFHFAGVHYPYGFHTLKFGGEDYIRKVKLLEKKYNVPRLEKQRLDDVLDETFRDTKDTELLLRYKYIVQKLYAEAKYGDLFELYVEGINYFMEHRFKQFIKNITNFADNTNAVLFLFADHGEEWDAYSEGHHNSLSDNVLRVPLVVYGKNIRSRIENRLVRSIDVAPTIMELLPNNAKKIKMDGRPLDIFHARASARKIYALAQVWMSIATKRQIAAYQQITMKKGKATKPLNTYLFAEIIRTIEEKVAFYYDKRGSILKEEKVVNRKKSRNANILRLKKILKDYNSRKQKKALKLSSIEAQIRNELINLGYNI